MNLVWLGQTVPLQPVDPPRWTRIEKLTAASIALGAVGLLWSMYAFGRGK